MLIGIDGNEANVVNRVGSNTYALEVLRHLEMKKTDDQFVIYLRNRPLNNLPEERAGWKYKTFGPQKFWTQFALPLHLYLERKKPDVFFTPGHYAPRFSPIPTVVSILDTSYLLFPQYFRRRDYLQLKNWTSYSVKNAAIVITISNSTKHDIIKYYRIKEDKISVVYPGYDRDRFYENLPVEKVGSVLDKYHIKKPYILFVGTIQPRKNLLALIEAYKKIREEGMKIDLVITGKIGWLYGKIIKETKSSEVAKDIRVTGFVDNKDLPLLYKGATCFVMPSLYEGFGIPVVEAMAVGTPVVISNTSSLPEIAGNAGIFIDPRNLESLEEGIKHTVRMPENERVTRIGKGLEQVKQYSWEVCVDQIYKVLEEVAHENNH